MKLLLIRLWVILTREVLKSKNSWIFRRWPSSSCGAQSWMAASWLYGQSYSSFPGFQISRTKQMVFHSPRSSQLGHPHLICRKLSGRENSGWMALLKCKECKQEISSRAPACPHCGCPLSTIKGISKKLKSHVVLSSIIFWIGLIWLFAIIRQAKDLSDMVGPPILIAASLAWYVITKVRIWWHRE